MIKMYPACRIHTQTWRSSVVLCFSPVLMEESFHLFFFFPSHCGIKVLGVILSLFFFFFCLFEHWLSFFPWCFPKHTLTAFCLSPRSLQPCLWMMDPPFRAWSSKSLCAASPVSTPLFLFFFLLPGERKKKTLFPRTLSRTQATLFLCTQSPRLSATSLSLLYLLFSSSASDFRPF